MIKIDSFVKKNSSSPSSSSNGGGFANGATTNTTTVQKELETHKLWGQNFNGTQDVDGDMTVNGNVSISGNVKATTGAITNIESESITNVGTITTDTVDATTIKGANANISNQLNIKDIISKDITTDYLTVTKSAHFWELVIDKISSTKGAIIVSPANCVVEDVELKDGQYTLYWRSEDKETGKAITNDFAVYDQIICQTFNAADGTSYDVNNKYYWWLITKVGRTNRTDSIRGGECYWNYITLSATDKDGDSLPEIGDNIAVLGNRTNEDRQNAIIISSTNSDYLDTDIQSPSVVQYKGIKSYDLKQYRYNVIAANGSTFIGNFKVVSSDGTLSDIESGKDGKGIKSIVTHYLASPKSSGIKGLTVWLNGTTTPPNLTTASPYLWQQIKITYTDNTYIYNNAAMIGSLGKDGQSTQYINVIAECSTEDFNSDKGTGHSYTSYVYLDGKLLSTAVYRGHTMIVVDPVTKTVNSTTNYDTYNEDDNTASTAMSNLITAIDNVANDKIIIIVSYDATSSSQALRDKLSNDYNSNIPSNATVWNRERYSHAIIIFKHSRREHQCFEQFNQFKPSYLTAYYTSDNMSLAGKDGNNGIMDKMSMTKTLATVNINDIMYVYIEGYVNHIDGDRTTMITDLSDYKLKLIDSNGRVSTAITSKTNTFAYSALWQSSYSQQTNRITHFRLQLLDKSGNILDEMSFNVTFDAGAVLTVGSNAITSSVQQSKNYTDGQISTVKQTADGIASRVTKIEGDYVTESELTQKANEINIGIKDNLKNKTGIDISTGKIILNAENTTVKGNLNLTDSANGMTVYNSDGNPVINLQPKNIASIDTFTKDTVNNVTLSVPSNTKGGSAIKIYTNKSNTISLTEGNVIQFDSIHYTFYANDGTVIYPSDLYINGGVVVYNSKDEIVYTYTFQFTRANVYGSYIASAVASYRVPTKDNYTFKVYITTPTSWASTYNVGGTSTIRIQTGNNVQTYIGSNGAFFHNSPNKMIYNSEESLRLQYGMNGIAFTNDTMTGNKAMQVIAGYKPETDGTYTPLFLPFYNYTPVTDQFTFTYQNIANIGSSRYAHVILPFTDRGYLLVDTPAIDANGNKQETWFVLPNSQIYSRNTYMSLPIGYTVKIINNLQGQANIYVTPYSTGKDVAKIYTAENTKVSSLKLSGDNSMKMFMYTGGFGTESGSAWRVID